MASLALLTPVFLLLAHCSVASGVASAETAQAESSFILKAAGEKINLRICNAFASTEGLDVYHLPSKELLTRQGDPLTYKQCRDMKLLLNDGDRIQLKNKDRDVGDFAVKGLPQSASLLLLVPHRRSGSTFAVFKSHAFGRITPSTAQVVTLDASHGEKSTGSFITVSEKLKQDDKTKDAEIAKEQLSFDQVVSLNPGNYDLSLHSSDDRKTSFAAVSDVNYVILRVGEQGHGKDSYPEELVVFPGSNTSRKRILLSFLLAACACACSLWS